MMRFLLAILLVPLCDLILLVWIGRQTSLSFVLLLVLAGAAAGLWLFGWQKRAMQHSLRRAMESGAGTGDAMSGVLAGYLAAILLFLPGVITDAMAMALLVPVSRRWLTAQLLRSMFASGQEGRAGYSADDDRGVKRDRIVEVRVIEPETGENRDS